MAASSASGNLLVAAIDFGTTYSGYAFSLKPTSSHEEPCKDIQINTNWGGSGQQVKFD